MYIFFFLFFLAMLRNDAIAIFFLLTVRPSLALFPLQDFFSLEEGDERKALHCDSTQECEEKTDSMTAISAGVSFLVKDSSDTKHADDGANLLGVQPSNGRDRRHKGEGVFDHVLDTPVSPIVLAIGSILLEQDHRFLVVSG